MNEVFKLLSLSDHDSRPRLIQGLYEVNPDEVVAKRDLLVTKAPYPLQSFRDVCPPMPRHVKTKQDAKLFIFNEGRLVCRYIYVEIHHRNGTAHCGEVRQPYLYECDQLPGTFRSGVSKYEDNDCYIGLPFKHKRYCSVEVIDHKPVNAPCKAKRYTMGDIFCGAGLTSLGAQQAGLKVLFGLEKWDQAMDSYRLNMPSAIDLEMPAENFHFVANRKNFGVDILHFSCPCQFWSRAQ